jgi:hypothetical protein
VVVNIISRLGIQSVHFVSEGILKEKLVENWQFVG